MSDQPKRYESELTLVIDRSKLPPKSGELPPVSTIPGPTIDQLADVARAQRDLEDAAPTLDACPAAGCADCATCAGRHHVACGECGEHTKDCPGTCSKCAVCRGAHMLSREALAAWERANHQPPPEAA